MDAIREERERNGFCPSCGNRLYQVTSSAGGNRVISKMNMFKRNNKQAADPIVTMTPLTIPGSVERGQCLRCKGSRIGVALLEGAEHDVANLVEAMPTAKAVPVVAKPAENDAADNRKQPPEGDLLRLKSPPPGIFNEVSHAAARKKSDASDLSGDDSVDLLNFALCNIDSDDFASSMKMKTSLSGPDLQMLLQNHEIFDKKPAAKPDPAQLDIDFSFLESQTSKKKGVELKCPSGMSPDVFYQLPLEMQKEVSGQQDKQSSSSEADDSSSDSNAIDSDDSDSDDTSSSSGIDPEALASLPEDIRKEVLEEQAKKKQRESFPSTKLSISTTKFLSQLDINEEDFENLPQEVKNDLMESKRQSYREDVTNLEDELSAGFDPEALASLPRDVREEVLENARKEREDRRRKESHSVVGAHSVNVPAGYDPDAFNALPEEMRIEIMDDAARQARNRGQRRRNTVYDDEDVARAMTVNAEPVGSNMTSCTYKGEYNTMGKRHGDGELNWSNGDKYVGRFKNGYIEGRGTISFRDGTEYSGQWRKNKFHGDGTRRFHNGNVYNGNYTMGKRQGQGKCYFANGDMYVGDWKNDTIHGFGRYYYNNGHSFEGMFRDGKRNGRGKYQLTDGKVEIYRYVNDCRVGDGVRWSSNRKKAWRMNGGKAIKRISMEEAAQIANRCGPQIEAS